MNIEDKILVLSCSALVPRPPKFGIQPLFNQIHQIEYLSLFQFQIQFQISLFGPRIFTIVNLKQRPTTTILSYETVAHAHMTSQVHCFDGGLSEKKADVYYYPNTKLVRYSSPHCIPPIKGTLEL